MSYLQTVILGGLAGLTIFLGLPVARLRLASRQYLSFLNALAIGILLFLFIEVMEHAVAPVEEALEAGEPSFLLFLLIVALGFGLHNATEGFGIAAPLADEKVVSWGFLTICGLIAGGPVFLGTVVGFSYTSEFLSVLFLALAGGAIIYVVNELFGAGRKLGAPGWAGWGITAGILLGFITEFILGALG